MHCHNDKGLALANALDAYRAGADIIDVAVVGLGERAGIIDLAELLINLIDMDKEGNFWQLSYLKDLYDFVSEQSHILIPPHQAVTGKNAFTHYAGVHVRAVVKDERLYQSLNPEILGIKSSTALGMQSGCAAVELAIKQIGREDLARNKDLITKILKEIKEISKRGTPIDIEKELPEIIERCTIKKLMTKMISG